MSLRVSGAPVVAPAAPFIDAIWRSSVDSVGDIDGTLSHSRRHSPILVRHGDPTSLTVQVRGDPAPSVTWYVGRKPMSAAGNADVSGDGRFRLESDWTTGRHTLRVSGHATEELDEGVWVIAGNEVGQDCTAVKIKTYRVLSSVADGTQLDSDSLPPKFRLRRKKSTDARPVKSSSSGHHSLPRELDPTRRRHKRATGDQQRSPYHSGTRSHRPHSSFQDNSPRVDYDDDFPTANEKSPSGTSRVTRDRRHPSHRLPSDWQDIPGRATPESLGFASDSFNESVASSPKLSSNGRPRRRVIRRQSQEQPQQQQRQTPPPALHQQQQQSPPSHSEILSAVEICPMAEKPAAGGTTAKNGAKKKKRKKKDVPYDNGNDDNKENNEETITASSVDNDSNCSRLVAIKNKVKKPSKTGNSVNSGGGVGRTDDGPTGTDVTDLAAVTIDGTDNFRRIEQWRKQSGDHYPTHVGGGDLRRDYLAVDMVDAIDNDDCNSSLWKIDGCDIRLSAFCAGLLGSVLVNDNDDDIGSPISLLSPPMTDMECLESLSTRGDVLSVRRHRNGSGKRGRGDRTSGHGGADSALGDSMLSNDDLSSTTTEPANLSTSMNLPPPPSYALTPPGVGRQNSWPDSADWWRNEHIPSTSEAADSETHGWVSPFAGDLSTAGTNVHGAPSSYTGDDERAAEIDDGNDDTRYDETSSDQLRRTSDINCGEMTADDELTANTDSEGESTLRRNSPYRQHPTDIGNNGDSLHLDEPPAAYGSVPSVDIRSLTMDEKLLENKLRSARNVVSDDDDELSTASSSSLTGSAKVIQSPATQLQARPSLSPVRAVAPQTPLYIVDIDISDVDSGRGATSASSADGDGRRGRNVERKARRNRPKSEVLDTATSKSIDDLSCRESTDKQLAPVTNGQRSSSGGRTVSPPVGSQETDFGRRVLSKSVDLLVTAKRPRSMSRTRQRTLSRERFERVTTTIKTETTIFVPPIQRSSSCGNVDKDGGSRLSTYFVADIECNVVSQSLSPSSLSDDDDNDVVSNVDLVPATSCPDDSAVDTVSEPEDNCAVDQRPEADDNNTASSSTLCETDFPYILESVDSFAVVPDETVEGDCQTPVTSAIIHESSNQLVLSPQADVNASDTLAETTEGHSAVLSIVLDCNATTHDYSLNDVIGSGITSVGSVDQVIPAETEVSDQDDGQTSVSVDAELVDSTGVTRDAWLIIDRAIHEIESTSYVTLIVDRAMEMVNNEIRSMSGIIDEETHSSSPENTEHGSIKKNHEDRKVDASDEQEIFPTIPTPDKSTVTVTPALFDEEAEVTAESRPGLNVLEASVEGDGPVVGLHTPSHDVEVGDSQSELTGEEAPIPNTSVDPGQSEDIETKATLVDSRPSDIVGNATDLDDPGKVNSLDLIMDSDENNDDDSTSSMSVMVDVSDITGDSPAVCLSVASDEPLNEVDQESLSSRVPLSNATHGFSDEDVGFDDNDDDDDDDEGMNNTSWHDSWWMKTTTKTTITICDDDDSDVQREPKSEPTQIWNNNPLSEYQKVVDLIDEEKIPRETQTPTKDKSKCNPPNVLGDFAAVPRSPRCDVTESPTDSCSPSFQKSSIAFSIQSIVIGSSVAGPNKKASFSREVSMEPADLDGHDIPCVDGELTAELYGNDSPCVDGELTAELYGHDIPCFDGKLTAELDGINAIHLEKSETVASSTKTDDKKGAGRPPSPIPSTSTVVHEYGEMLTIFGRLPPFVEALKSSVAHRHEIDPQVCRLLARYPSLRPGTWQWTVLPRIEDLRRQMLGLKADEGHETRDNVGVTPAMSGSTKVVSAVVNSTSYVIEPVVERFGDVIDRVN